MSPEFIQYLEDTYPKLFSEKCEISVGDGWFQLVDILCKKIQGHIDSSQYARQYAIKWNSEVNNPNFDWDANYPMFERKERPVPELVSQVTVYQIKEKFGGLRFNCHGGDEYVQGAISVIEALSVKVCEECGSPGEATRQGWIKVLCQEHQLERELKIENGQ